MAKKVAVFCVRCGRDLPEGSQFCLRCGQAVALPTHDAIPADATDPLVCGKCGIKLIAGAQFCPKCGYAVPPGRSAGLGASPAQPAPLRPPRRKPRFVLWFLAAFLAIFVAWAATSPDPTAQSFQRLFNRSHTEEITPSTFTVQPHSFSSYRIAVPQGASDVTVSGTFSATGGEDNNVEVYLLTDVAFVDWQNGYSGGDFYESGRVARADVLARLPAKPGTYYLVFSNNFSKRAPKAVESSVILNYKRWWPLW